MTRSRIDVTLEEVNRIVDEWNSAAPGVPAMTRSRIEESQGPFTERPEDLQCHACGETRRLAPSCVEPTDYCDRCAQLLLPDAVAACKAWVDYFDELQHTSDPNDRISVLRNDFHRKRMDACRKVVEKAKAGL